MKPFARSFRVAENKCETDPIPVPTLTNAHMKNWMDCVRAGNETNAPVEAGYNHSIADIMVTAALRTGQRATMKSRNR